MPNQCLIMSFSCLIMVHSWLIHGLLMINDSLLYHQWMISLFIIDKNCWCIDCYNGSSMIDENVLYHQSMMDYNRQLMYRQWMYRQWIRCWFLTISYCTIHSCSINEWSLSINDYCVNYSVDGTTMITSLMINVLVEIIIVNHFNWLESMKSVILSSIINSCWY